MVLGDIDILDVCCSATTMPEFLMRKKRSVWELIT